LADAASTHNTNRVTSPPVDLHFESFVDAIVTDHEAFVPDTPIPNIRNNNTVQSNNTQQSNQVPSSKNKQKYVFRHHDNGGYFHGLYYNPLPPDHKVRKRMAGASDKDGDVHIFEITLNDIVVVTGPNNTSSKKITTIRNKRTMEYSAHILRRIVSRFEGNQRVSTKELLEQELIRTARYRRVASRHTSGTMDKRLLLLVRRGSTYPRSF
jgi:hypothetical protein